MVARLITNRIFKKTNKKGAFTLPEVIISFSILAMVVTSAVSVLSLVMRTNADNVSSLIANGLAQEGIEAVRFIRDSNVILGLDFDGGRQGNSTFSVWGEPLFDDGQMAPKYFLLINMQDVLPECPVMNLGACLPIQLEEINVSDLDDLAVSDKTQVYLSKKEGETFRYFQRGGGSALEGDERTTQYHRVIRIEPLQVDNDFGVKAMRVSSIVFWPDLNNKPKKLVLTTDLTNFR